MKLKLDLMHCFLFVLFASMAPAISPTSAETLTDVPAIDWLPLTSTDAVLRSYNAADGSQTPYILDRWEIMADNDELARKIETLQKDPPTIIVVFGDYLSKYIAEKCPNLPQIQVLTLTPATSANVTAINCEPDAGTIWKTANSLLPNLHRLGILFSEAYGPNLELAKQLEATAEKGKSVIRATVPRGLCRTDSDYQNCVAALVKAGGCDLLYLPDDPNSSRFASTICEEARAAKIPVLGTEATLGKGCVAALMRNFDSAGKELSKVLAARLANQRDVPPQTVKVPTILKVDEARISGFTGLQVPQQP